MTLSSSVEVAGQPCDDVASRRRVSWWAVIPLAAVLAYADGFWLISLRGAVGAVERTDAPFETWLRESAVSLPIFVLAVLGALTLGLRRFGPSPRGRGVLGVALLVTATSTLAGIAVMVASSAYDYHLQMNLLRMMESMRSSCASGNCLAQMQQSTLDLQVRAAGFGTVLLLVTNVVVVFWVLALRGGRLDTAGAPKTGRPRLTETMRSNRLDDLRLLLVVGLVGSAVIHAAVVPEHLREWQAAGLFFVALAAAELVVANLVLVRQPAAALLAGAVSLGPLVLWAYSRTIGLPFGPEPGVPEAVGLADCAACALELATLIVAVVVIKRAHWLRRRPPASEHVGWLIVWSVIAVSVLGVAGSSLGWVSVIGNAMTMTSAG